MTFITPTVQINGFGLHETANLRYVTALRVDSGTPQMLDVFKVAKSDRHKVTGGWFDVKAIEIEGMVEATDETLLTAKLDALKAAVTGVDIKLFVSDGVNNRIWYVSTSGAINIAHDRMEYVATWSAKYIVANPPYGIEADSSGNVLVNTQSFSLSGTQNVFTPVFAGSARPTPKLQFTLSSAGVPDLTNLEFLNRETGQSLSIPFAGYTLANGDVLVIDSARREVLLRGRSIGYDGTIPDFVLGSNELEVFYVTANTNIQVATQKVVNDYEIVRDTIRVAQAFTPASGQNLAYVSLALSKTLLPVGNVRVGIMADSGGSPSGTYLGGTVNIDMATIKEKTRWFTVALAGTGITAGLAYWIVADAPGATGGQTQNVRWAKSRQDQGFGVVKTWDGSAWNTALGDMAFRAYASNSSAQNQSVDTQAITDNFSTNTRKDTANTTAQWNNSYPAVLMNGVNTTPTESSSGTGYSWITDACHYCDAAFFKFTAQGLAAQNVTLTGFTIRLKTTYTSPSNFDWFIRNNYNDSSYLATGVISVTSSGFLTYTVTGLNVTLTAGNTYWIGGNGETYGVAIEGVQGTGGSTFDGTTTTAVLLTDYSRNIPSFSGTWAYTGSFNHTINFQYTSYATPESAVTLPLNTGNADIISASQYVITGLLQNATFAGSISADNGANYTSIARNNAAFQTETVPAVVGNQLKWKGTLQNTVKLVTGLIYSITMYWREGISLDASTKRASQSFTSTITGSVNAGKLMIMKYGTPGSATVRIETDNAGSPSGTLVNANATATLATSGISSTSFGLTDISFAGSFTLTAGTTYHIVVVPTVTYNDSNKLLLHANYGRYSTYEMKRSTNSGTSYSGFTSGASGYDLIFSISGAGGTSFTSNLDVTYSKLWL